MSTGDRPALPDFLAQALSYVMSPVLIPLYTTAIVVVMVRADTAQAFSAFAFIGLAFCVIPIADIVWMVSRGFATSVDLPDRRERREPLTLSVVSGLVGFILYSYLTSGLDVISILAATYIANLLVVLVINFFWKISVHAVGVAGILAVTLYLVGPAFRLAIPFESLLVAALVLLVPLVMWARLHLEMHTMAQVAAGACLGFVGHWAGFYFGTQMLF